MKLVLAPAGSGKTTAVRHAVEGRPGPLVWYRLGRGDDDPERLLHNIGAAACAAVGASNELESIDDLIGLVDRLADQRGSLVLDEIEHVGRGASQRLLDEVLTEIPAEAAVYLVGRERPDCNFTLLSVRGMLADIGVDQLRFRLWEVDQLFASTFGMPLPPRETAEVERRTQGWAAGLQLFFLATRGASHQSRQDTLRRIGGRQGPAQEFLAANVIDALPDDVRNFLETCVVLPELQPEICDRLRGARDSQLVLGEIERHQLFLSRNESGGSFVLHDVIRTHIENRLLASVGEGELCARYEAAGDLLADIADVDGACHCYSCGQAWDKLAALLERRGGEVATDAPQLSGSRDGVTQVHEPWLELVAARRALWDGDLGGARRHYLSVRDDGRGGAVSTIAAKELEWIDALTTSGHAQPARTWAADVMAALTGSVAQAAPGPRSAPELLVDGLSLLLTGSPEACRECWTAALEATGDSAVEALASAGLVLLGWMQGAEDHSVELGRLLVDRHDWATRLVAAVDGIAAGERTGIDVLLAASEARGDRIGEALGSLLMVMMSCAADTQPVDDTRVALSGFDAIDAWLLAFTYISDPSNSAVAGQLSRLLRTVQIPGLAGVIGDPRPRRALARAFGYARFDVEHMAPVQHESTDDGHGADEPVLACFGSFSLLAPGPIEIDGLRPRARDVLRLLAIHSPSPVHRDVLMAAFWADDSETSARRKLQVAVSAIRGLLDPLELRDHTLVRRVGEAYALVVNSAGSDVAALRDLCREIRDATSPLTGAELDRFARLIESFATGLLRECGSATWIVDEREHLTNEVRSATHHLVAVAEGADLLEQAVTVCELMLQLDPLDLALWEKLSELTNAQSPARGASVDARRAAVAAKLHDAS